MKPVELRFKGLNSYINEQIIDFNKLTSKGLFGIFGPTGSGKSTILDGITIALYGDLPRKSKEYINTNCNELTVEFKFSLKSKEGLVVYTAQRCQRKDKNGGIRTTYARLIKHAKCDEIIAEKATDMKEQIIQLLGLTMDDFTRSVVLPQGKFSDFLKLTGKDRRVMLERIFALEKYGKRLNDNLKQRYNNEKIKENYLRGQLKRYEGISEGTVEKLRLEKQTIQEDYLITKTELQNVSNIYDKYKEVWQLQKELIEEEQRLKSVLEQKQYMAELKEKVSLCEKAYIIAPHIEAIKQTNELITENRLQLEELSYKLKTLTENKNKYEDKLHNVEQFESSDLPKWHEKIGSLKEAIELLNREQEIEEETNKLQSKISEQKEKINKLTEDIKKHENDYSKLNKKLEELSIREKDNTLNTDYKLLIDKGLQVEKEIELRVGQLNDLKSEFNNTRNRVNDSKTFIDKYENEIEILLKSIDELSIRLNDLTKDNPGDLEGLTILQQEIMDLKKTFDDLELNKNKLNQLEREKTSLLEVILQQTELLKEQEKNYEILIKQKIEVEQIIEEQKGKYIAATIASKLRNGEACPVCGSTEHLNLASYDVDINLEGLETKKEEIEEKLDNIVNNKNNIEVEIMALKRQEQELHKEIKKLYEELKDKDIATIKSLYESRTQQFITLKGKIQDFREENDVIQKKLAELNNEYSEKKQILSKYNENVKINQDRLMELREKIQQEDMKVKSLKNTLLEYKKIANVENFSNEKVRITQIEKELEKILSNKKNIQDEINKLISTTEEKNKILNQLNVSIERDINTRKINDREKSNLKVKIDYLSDNRNPKEYLKELQDKITKYQEGAKKVREKYQYYLQKQNEFSIAKAKKEQALIELSTLYNRQKDEKNRLLMEYSFENDQQVLNNLLTKDEMDKSQKVIEDYEEKLKNTLVNVTNIKKKLNNNSVTEEDYNQIANKKKGLEDKKDNLIKLISEKDTKLTEMKNSLKEVNKLKKEKEEIDHTISMLEDLIKLIKGNKFIEYISKSQFRYIVNEASKRLNQLTGRYGIELDEQGEFLIRDDKNGGALREAATLSGGETFLTSLALALALSSHIQLKGSYPLEFFFLDEGFGTLDSELLDVVMDSLEKLNNAKITVGIISHVEELKNRVPVKLLISPSIESGSEIVLDYS